MIQQAHKTTQKLAQPKTTRQMRSGLKQIILLMYNQSRESLQILKTFKNETFAQAKKLIHFPNQADRKQVKNKTMLLNLKNLEVATKSEIEVLKKRIQKLENTHYSRKNRKTMKKS